jgi:glycosyltransferase involved in cell wall biosynthesis
MYGKAIDKLYYINGRFLTQEMTGVQRFATEISREILSLSSDAIIVAPAKTKRPVWLPPQQFATFGYLPGHLWEQLSLPIYLLAHGKGDRYPLLVDLTSTGPLLVRNQISTHHDITYVRFPESFSWKFRLLYRLLIPILIRRSNHLLTVSEFSRQEISRFYDVDPSKLTIVYNAVADRFVPSDLPRQPFLLAVSSPNAHKNFTSLIRAATPVLNEHPNLRLVIVGSQQKSFARQDFESIHHPQVEFTGRISDDELIKLYQKAMAFIFPSLYEGFGIPPLEAQSCGCPVVASDAASLSEVLGDSALFFNPNNVADMTRQINRIVTDQDLRNDLSAAGLNNVTRFSWHNSAARVLAVINSVQSTL